MGATFGSEDSTQYQGSQAFNQLLTSTAQVNINTGSFSLTNPLVNLPGIHKDISLNIQLVYSHGCNGVFGLPTNWQINLPYLTGRQSLSWNGNTYVQDRDWISEDGYQSGLRYINHHGIRFQEVIPPRPLPSGRGREYSFHLRDDNGMNFYFDETGKLLQEQDRFGNRIEFDYVEPQQGPSGNRLLHVKDSFSRQITFSYGLDSTIKVSLPGGGSTTIFLSQRGVERWENSLGHATVLDYEKFNNSHVINQIRHETGLATTLKYTKISYRSANGETGEFPAVRDIQHFDSGNGNQLLEHTNYSYGESTGNTFTGYKAGYKISGKNDGLMESNNFDFRYDVRVRKLNEKQQIFMATKALFNYLHLPVESEYFLIQNGQTVNGSQQTNKFPTSIDHHARTCNYNKPTQLMRYQWSSRKHKYTLVSKVLFGYDSYGKMLTQSVFSTDEPQPRTSTQNSYVAAAWGGEMPHSTVVTDHVTGAKKRHLFELTKDQKHIQRATVEYMNAGSKSWNPWKTTSYTHDSIGRQASLTLRWTDTAGPPSPDYSKTTTRYSYHFDPEKDVLTTVTTNDHGFRLTDRYAMRLAGGPKIESENALGAKTRYEYDLIGRATRITDAAGHATTMAYKTLRTDGINATVSTRPDGYTATTYCDALGRETKTTDHDPKNSHTRTLGQIHYNCLGAVSAMIDRQGLITTFEYDGLKRRVKSKDPYGNTTTREYDALSVVHKTNGFKSKTIHYDGLGHAVTEERYPFPGEKTDRPYTRLSQVFDGFGRLAESTFLQVESNTQTPDKVAHRACSHDADGNLIDDTFVGYLGQEVRVNNAYGFDLLGKGTSCKRMVVYADGRKFTHEGDVQSHDSLGQLISVRNRLGQTEHFAYDAAGNVSSHTRFDGSKITFAYTPNNQVASKTGAGFEQTYIYDANQRLETLSDGVGTVRYEYCIDGQVKSVLFPDSLRQHYDYDELGRISRFTDPSSARTMFCYNALGQLTSKQHHGDELFHHYGEVNGKQGILTGLTLEGQGSFKHSFEYDAYGSMNKVLIVDGKDDSQVFLESSLDFDALRRLRKLVQKTPDAQFEKQYGYDGLNQLTEETFSGAGSSPHGETVRFRYDGNGNVLSKSITGNGGGKEITYQYNELDQLIKPDCRYDANGRMQSNGADKLYCYDSLDRLLAVATGEKEDVRYSYYPDGLLSGRAAGDLKERFYYSNQVVSAVVRGEKQWTSFLHGPNGPVAAYGKDEAPLYFFTSFGSTAASKQGDQHSTFRYDAYGRTQSDTALSSDRSFQWKQEYADRESGLVYLRSRFYDPETMRFLSRDSVPLHNRYNFGFGDPINQFDPSGHLSTSALVMDTIGITLGIAAAVAAPFSGGSSLVVGAAVTSGLLGAASSSAALVYDASDGKDKSAETVSNVLAIAGLILDVASAATSVAAKLGAKSARTADDMVSSASRASYTTADHIGETTSDIHDALGNGIAYLGEHHTQGQTTLGVVEGLVNRPNSRVTAISLEVPTRIERIDSDPINRVFTHYGQIRELANTREIPVLYHDPVMPRRELFAGRGTWGTVEGVADRNEHSAGVIRSFIRHELRGNPQGLLVIGGSDHFVHDAVAGLNAPMQSQLSVSEFAHSFFDLSPG